MDGVGRSVSRWFAAGLAAVVVGGTIAELIRRRASRMDAGELFEAERYPVIPAPSERPGDASSRGHATAYALDVEQLRGDRHLEPVVEYLTYIQSQRGDESHILFVRYDDLDLLARRQGEQVTTFLERLDQLGVVVSNN